VIYILLNGVEFGLVLAFLIGPVFFTILQTSVEKGFWIGVLVALGVSASDVIYVLICHFGFSALVAQPGITFYMGLLGGTILVAFGAYHLFIKSRQKDFNNPGVVREQRPLRYLAKGFIINSMSPMVPLFWIGAVSMANIEFGYSSGAQFSVFFTGVLVTALATDIAKAYLAGRLRELITYRLLVLMNIIVGLVLMIFGGRLLFVTLQS
jgi:threonine/homoserine/homoserine lactone efflux protein